MKSHELCLGAQAEGDKRPGNWIQGKKQGATTLWDLAWTGQGLTQRSRGGVEGDDLCLSVSFKKYLLSTSSVQGWPREGEPDVSLNLGKCTVVL